MSRVLVVLCALAGMAGHASAQIVRVSVSTAGVEANGQSLAPSISADGRYVVFESQATNLVAGDTNGYPDIFLRDRDTDADGVFDEPGAVSTIRVNVGLQGQQMGSGSYNAVISANGRFVFFGSFDPSLAPFPAVGFSIFRVDLTDGTMLRVGSDMVFQTTPAVSADGDVLVYQHSGIGLMIRQTSSGATIPVPAPYTPAPGPGQTPALLFHASPTISADGRRIAYVTAVGRGGQPSEPTEYRAWEFDRVSGVTTLLATDDPQAVSITATGEAAVLRLTDAITRRVTASGARTPVLAAPPAQPPPSPFPTQAHRVRPIVSPTGRFALTESALLHDFDTGLTTSLGFEMRTSLACPQTGCMPWGAFSGDDRMLALVSPSPLVAGDTNGAHDVFVIDLRDQLDADDDTMDDRLETLFGVTDPAADPDADGQTNAQELAAGTHPNGQVQRFLAEGATGTFFHTTIALANPDSTLAAAAVLTFDNGTGARVRRPIAIPAGQSAVVDVGAVSALEASDVSTTVESDRFLGVERSMTWGTGTGTIYGSHAETATPAPSPTWFLAEGSTVLGMDLFYLLQNPQATTTHASVRFLLPSGTVITRTYDLAPSSRTTIYVNQIAGLDETDVSGDISADAPIVVERSQYRSAPGQTFTLGHDSMGVPAAATSWFFAEGATGTFFDLYMLIVNPGDVDATVQALYSRADGGTVTRTYTVRAHSRFSIFVDAIPGLEHTALATAFTSTVPIVAERAMYWPGGYFDYYEGHSSAGSTTTALDWVVAGAENGGTDAAQTYILIANTENRAGEARVTLLPNAPTTQPAPAPTVIPLPANSRTTVPAAAIAGPYGARVTSIGASPVQIVVESAVYRTSGGVTWSAGANALATPVP